MRALVCGGRDFEDRDFAFDCLDRFHAAHPIRCVIHGAARGADTLGAEWASALAVPADAYPADWKRHGRAAGPIRNEAMLANGRPDIVIAFPGGRGTAHMVRIATEAKVGVWQPKAMGDPLPALGTLTRGK